MAEVLVPNQVSADDIKRIIVHDSILHQELTRALFGSIPCDLDKTNKFYF